MHVIAVYFISADKVIPEVAFLRKVKGEMTLIHGEEKDSERKDVDLFASVFHFFVDLWGHVHTSPLITPQPVDVLVS